MGLHVTTFGMQVVEERATDCLVERIRVLFTELRASADLTRKLDRTERLKCCFCSFPSVACYDDLSLVPFSSLDSG